MIISATLMFGFSFGNLNDVKANEIEKEEVIEVVTISAPVLSIENNVDIVNGNGIIEPMSITWAMILAALLTYAPQLSTFANNFVYGYQVRGGSPGFLGMSQYLYDNFDTYVDAVTAYWSKVDNGCVLHTPNVWLCPSR